MSNTPPQLKEAIKNKDYDLINEYLNQVQYTEPLMDKENYEVAKDAFVEGYKAAEDIYSRMISNLLIKFLID